IDVEGIARACEPAEAGVLRPPLHRCSSASSHHPHSGLAGSYRPILRWCRDESHVPGTDIERPPLWLNHRGPNLDETPRGPEPPGPDGAAALLHLAPPARRAFIGPLIALIERVVADGERPRSDRG